MPVAFFRAAVASTDMVKSKFPKPISGKPLEGILQIPIENPEELILGWFASGTPETIQKQLYKMTNDFVEEQINERILALAKHYEVDLNRPESHRKLLLRVSQDFIVGLCYSDQVSNINPGRPKSRLTDNILELLRQVEILQSTKQLSARQACQELAKRRRSKWAGVSSKALLMRFNRAKKEIAESAGYQNRHEFYITARALVEPYKDDFMSKKKVLNSKRPA